MRESDPYYIDATHLSKRMIKVRIPGENFWIRVLEDGLDYVIGYVDNHLITNTDFHYDDLVAWHKESQVLFLIGDKKKEAVTRSSVGGHTQMCGGQELD